MCKMFKIYTRRVVCDVNPVIDHSLFIAKK